MRTGNYLRSRNKNRELIKFFIKAMRERNFRNKDSIRKRGLI